MVSVGESALINEWLHGGDPDPAVGLDEFLDPVFPDGHADFAAFCSESPWEIEDRSDLERIDEDALDRYVGDTTRFDSWREMVNHAAEREVCRRFLV